MGRDRGRGKGGGRGGGKKMYIANVEELEKRERDVDSTRREDDDGEDDDEEEEVSKQDKGGETVFTFERKTRAELAAERAAAGGDAEPEVEEGKGVHGLLGSMTISNPNRAKKPVEKMIKVKDLDASDAPADPEAGMNRKEREALAALKAKEDYQRRHMAGETEQAKRELAQLALVRARREAAAKKREEEGRAPGWTQNGVESSSDTGEDDEEEGDAEKGPKAPKAPPAVPPSIAKKKAAVEAEEAEVAAADGAPPKLKSMDIKKMSGDVLKEHLKARGLETQGQKKDLIKRLCDYEAARS